MATREFACELGGGRRVFKYTNKERDYLEERFDADLFEIMHKKALPTDSSTGKVTGIGRRNVQVALVWAGLRHSGKAVTEARVSEWMEQYVHDHPETGIMEVITTAIAAVWDSGVMGFIPQGMFDMPKEDEKEADPKESAAPVSEPEKPE